MQRSSSGHEEGRENDHERHKRSPERKHVQDGKRHIRRANLNRQKVISEPALRRRGQHEEDHDRAVHGEQAQVSFRLDLAHQRQNRRRPDHVNSHQQRQEHPDKHCHQREKVILQPDHLVIQAEDVFADKPLRGVRVDCSRSRHYCFSASRVASHLSKSSWLTTVSMPCIL